MRALHPTDVFRFLASHAAGFGALLLAGGHALSGAGTATILQDLAIAGAAFGLNLAPAIQARLRDRHIP